MGADLQLVVQNTECIEGSRLRPQHQRSERQGPAPGRLRRRNLGGREIAFRSDENQDRLGRPLRQESRQGLRPRLEGRVLVMQEKLSFGIGQPAYEFQDYHGNITYRSTLMPGRNEIRHDALVAVSSLPDTREVLGPLQTVSQLHSDLLRYTLPSRYCDSDKLMDFAWNNFGHVTHGLPRVQAICDWVHNNIEYRYGSGRPDLSASEVIGRRHGVCRDFAHAAIALCRAFNLPARYVTGHLPDIGGRRLCDDIRGSQTDLFQRVGLPGRSPASVGG